MRGRIRSIKPEVLSDDELWDLEEQSGMPLYRAWTGLWMYADKEGRFAWKPRQLGAVILPYWGGDFEHVLGLLESARYVIRYVVDGKAYGLVRTFKRHQVVNHREAASELPPPPAEVEDGVFPGTPGHAPAEPGQDEDASQADLASVPGITGGKGREGKGIEGKGEGGEVRGRAGARARGETTPLPPSDFTPSQIGNTKQMFTAERMAALFEETFQTLRQVSPKMTGQGVEGFHAQVVGTARARGVEPHQLFRAVLHRWLTGELNKRELGAPYACFAADWGALVERANGHKPATPLAGLREALRTGDRDSAERQLEEHEQQERHAT